MRFPIQVASAKNCPVCQAKLPAKKTPDGRESATLSFVVFSQVQGKTRPVFLGASMMLGWDTGVLKGPQSRSTIGAALFVANKKKQTKDLDPGTMKVVFCSTDCLRSFLNEAVDDLERRAEEVKANEAKLLKAKGKKS